MRILEEVICHHPQTVAEAVELMAKVPEAGLVAGGTDLIVQWQAGAVPMPAEVINVLSIADLCEISETETDIIIGAGATHAAVKDSAIVQTHLPALAQACATVGALQIQNRGTIGGNLANASPAGDTPPALLITDGTVVVAGPDGERTVALTDFFLDYRKIDLKHGELIVRVELPKKPQTAREFFHKIGTRGAQAISKVMAAVRIELDQQTVQDIRIAMGSVAATTVRLPRLESWLKGKELTEDVITQAETMASEEVTPIADIRSTAEYREWVSGRIIRGILTKMTL